MRTCKRCGTSKPLDEFYEIRYQTKRGEARCRQHTCASCCVKASVKNRKMQWSSKYKAYATNFYSSEAATNRQRACRDRLRALVDSAKSGACMDCRRKFHPVCMDFDHRNPASKTDSVTQLVAKRRKWEVIAAEIAKCDLVCANCHRIRTAAAGGWLKRE
jgi:hypothetical protein